MAKPAARIVFLEAVLVLAGASVVARSFWLQVIHHRTWIDKAGSRRNREDEIPARRGRIYDRNGRPLAVSQEQYRVSISLTQVKDTAALKAKLPRLLNLPRAKVEAAFRNSDPYFYGPFGAEQIDPIRREKGVYLEVLYQRVYPVPGLADRVLGHVNERGDSGVEGVEKSLDRLLQGTPGRAHYLVDAKGKKLIDPLTPLVDAIPGQDVELTIDSDLQAICESVLRNAVEDLRAHGGDIVIMDIHTGELYAVASLRTDTATGRTISAASAFLDPNQPGSTSKIFTAAALLRSGTDTTPVIVEGATWLMPIGTTAVRPITDVHPLHGPVSIGEMIKVSSNIAVSKFAIRLRPEQQYMTIRDFGFGQPTGSGFPGEAGGKLRLPVRWENDRMSMTSLAQGYEWEATAVQLAAGYGAIANHGVLMAPTLVRRVRDDRDGVVWQHHADTVRRAVPDNIAAQLLAYLRLTEDSGGTGAKAQLNRFRVAGKTGTAKRGKTPAEGYRSSYVGIFPDNAPQVVMFVMIDRPVGKIYGGDVAAPRVPEVMQQALAARTSPLDRSLLMANAALPPPPPPMPPTPPPRRVALGAASVGLAPTLTAVPGVVGMPARLAIAALERSGFQVRVVGRAHVRSTLPVAGDSLPRGTLVTVYADSTR